MKKIIMLFLIILILFISIFSQNKIALVEKEIKEILKSTSPSIVMVISENRKKYIATGIAIERDLIITNTLVTYHPYHKIYVKTVNGRSYPAKVIGKDRRYSTILLKLNTKVMTPIKRSTKLAVGDWIALVGVFYKEFPSIFQGIVSSISGDDLILNAPVFPGASGGAVVNKNGELVAVIRGSFGIAAEPNLSIIDRNKGQVIFRSPRLRSRYLCYAIPVKKVMEISNHLKKYGEVKRGWLGVYLLNGKSGKKVIINSVVKDSPAKKAGLKKGDIIISINGKNIYRSSDVSRIVRSMLPEKVVNIEIQRNKLMKRFLVKMGKLRSKKIYEFGNLGIKIPDYPQIPELSGSLPKEKNLVMYWNTTRRLGIDVIELTVELAKKFKIKEGHGLMISKVYKKSSAHKAGLLEGDIIIKASKNRVKNISDLHSILNKMADNESIVITFYRDQRLKSLDIVPELIKESQLEWSIVKDRVKIFSNYFYNNFFNRTESSLSKQREKILLELKRLKEYNKRISENELRKVENKIYNLKRENKEMYWRELRKIQVEENRLKEEMRRFREEEIRLIKEIEKIRNRLKKKKNKTPKESKITV